MYRGLSTGTGIVGTASILQIRCQNYVPYRYILEIVDIPGPVDPDNSVRIRMVRTGTRSMVFLLLIQLGLDPGLFFSGSQAFFM
jgi:hypothetical protein